MKSILFILFLTNIFSSKCFQLKNSIFCDLNNLTNEIICDGENETNGNETNFLPIPSSPFVKRYIFKNFGVIEENAFENITFPENQTIKIEIINVSRLKSRAFSDRMFIPESSTISIQIAQSNIELERHSFYGVKLNQLEFFQIENFGRTSIFESEFFGGNVEINELIFNQTSLVGFKSSLFEKSKVKTIRIVDSPQLTKFDQKTIPDFLDQTEIFQLTNTGLTSIDEQTFSKSNLILKEFILTNNSFLKNFPSNIFGNSLNNLEKLDFSFNPIENLDSDYDWFNVEKSRILILKNQRIELFLRSKILKNFESLEKLDFSSSFTFENENSSFIDEFVFPLKNLVSIDLSWTNLTQSFLIDWLKILSKTANRTVDVLLRGRNLDDEHFCEFFDVFDAAPHLIQLELDEEHPCNCVVELFYRYGNGENSRNSNEPFCLSDPQRTRCNISNQLAVSKCRIKQTSSDVPDQGFSLGSYGIIGIAAGSGLLLIVVLTVGSRRIYRNRTGRRTRSRTSTVADMEKIIEDSQDISIEEFIESTSN